MIGSHDKKFIFFHNKKSAGTSIRYSLKSYNNFARNIHYTVSEFQKESEKCKAIFDEYYTFAFVRNPYDWHLSFYNYASQNPTLAIYKFIKNLTFDEFIEWKIEKDIMTQYSFLSDDGTDSSNISLDFIGKFENLEKDFNIICDALSLNTTLGHYNKSNSIGELNEYNKELIYNTYKKDFDYFGYDK